MASQPFDVIGAHNSPHSAAPPSDHVPSRSLSAATTVPLSRHYSFVAAPMRYFLSFIHGLVLCGVGAQPVASATWVRRELIENAEFTAFVSGDGVSSIAACGIASISDQSACGLVPSLSVRTERWQDYWSSAYRVARTPRAALSFLVKRET